MPSRLIRGFGVGAIVPGALVDAHARADALLAEAARAADAVRAEADADAARICVEARARGAETARAETAALLLDAAAIRDRALSDAQHEVVTLALAVARRVVGDALAEAPATVAHLAAEAIARARGATQLLVVVHPDHRLAVEGLGAARGVPLTIETDPALASGDVVVHSDVGRIDARLATKLAVLEQALRRELGEAPP